MKVDIVIATIVQDVGVGNKCLGTVNCYINSYFDYA